MSNIDNNQTRNEVCQFPHVCTHCFNFICDNIYKHIQLTFFSKLNQVGYFNHFSLLTEQGGNMKYKCSWKSKRHVFFMCVWIFDRVSQLPVVLGMLYVAIIKIIAMWGKNTGRHCCSMLHVMFIRYTWETRHYIKLLVKSYRCKYLSCGRYLYVCLFSKELK